MMGQVRFEDTPHKVIRNACLSLSKVFTIAHRIRQIMKFPTLFDSSGFKYQQSRIAHWDTVAIRQASWRGLGSWYHGRLEEIYRFHVNPNQYVLEIGCANGSL